MTETSNTTASQQQPLPSSTSDTAEPNSLRSLRRNLFGGETKLTGSQQQQQQPGATTTTTTNNCSNAFGIGSNVSESSKTWNRLEVYLRIRPLSENEPASGSTQNTTSLLSSTSVTRVDPHRVLFVNENHPHGIEFDFDGVFGPEILSESEEQTKEIIEEERQRGELNSNNKDKSSSNVQRPVPNFTPPSSFCTSGSQRNVYRTVGIPLVKAFFAGNDALLAAYGVSNSGKTFTIQGTVDLKEGKFIDPGILPRMLDSIFESIRRLKDDKVFLSSRTQRPGVGPLVTEKLSSGPSPHDVFVVPLPDTHRFIVWVSFYEIYNEKIYDLLVPQTETRQREVLRIKEDKAGRIFVRDISEHIITTAEEGKKLLLEGLKNRQVAETTLNRDSSRSHSLFTLKLAQVPKGKTPEQVKADPNLVKYSRLTVVDLAGSERAYRTGALGERIKEASHINRSLMTLSQVIEKLRYNQQHPKLPPQVVPFRDSQLTRLMQDYFQGSAKAVLVVNVNPSLSDSDETLHVLKFASVAKTVKTSTIKKRPLVTNPFSGVNDNTATSVTTTNIAGRIPPSLPPQTPLRFPPNNPSTNNKTVSNLETPRPTRPPPHPEFNTPSVNTATTTTTTTTTTAIPNLDDIIDGLMDEIEMLRVRVVNAESERHAVEMRVRDEAAKEVAKQLAELEALYEERLLREHQILEEKYLKKLGILEEMNRTLSQALENRMLTTTTTVQGSCSSMQSVEKTVPSGASLPPSPSLRQDNMWSERCLQLETQLKETQQTLITTQKQLEEHIMLLAASRKEVESTRIELERVKSQLATLQAQRVAQSSPIASNEKIHSPVIKPTKHTKSSFKRKLIELLTPRSKKRKEAESALSEGNELHDSKRMKPEKSHKLKKPSDDNESLEVDTTDAVTTPTPSVISPSKLSTVVSPPISSPPQQTVTSSPSHASHPLSPPSKRVFVESSPHNKENVTPHNMDTKPRTRRPPKRQRDNGEPNQNDDERHPLLIEENTSIASRLRARRTKMK